jgi:cytidylate kinase
MDPAQDPLQIAIDGPAGSGKSSVAALVAQRLGLTHVDTGAMYRALTYSSLREKIAAENEDALSARLDAMEIEFRDGSLYLDGEDLSRAIRTQEVTERVSQVSAHAKVRRVMVARQRHLCRQSPAGSVLEGRDIGSVVLPLSRCKIYLDAQLRERAKRRLLQTGEEPSEARLDELEEEIRRRDQLDSEREHSPLLISPDAHVIDTSAMSLEEVVQEVARLAEAARPVPADRSALAHFRFRKWTYAWVVRLIRLVFFRPCGMRVFGRANAELPEAVLFASNHISHYDPPVAGSALGRELYFLAKRELFVGVFGKIIAHFDAIPIRRGRWDEEAFQAAISALKRGESLMFFPEGTRKPPGRPGPGKRGLGILLERTGVPMLPVFVRGTDRLRDCFLRRARLEVWIGPPLRLHALKVLKETMSAAAVQQRIASLWLSCVQELAERSAQRAAKGG